MQDQNITEETRKELEAELAELKGEDGIVRARPTQSLDGFLFTVQRFRLAGIEVVCEFKGIRFNNMDGINTQDSYYNASKSKTNAESTELRGKDGIARPKPGQDLDSFLEQVQRLRDSGIGTVCEFDGIKFNNMDGFNTVDSYHSAKKLQKNVIKRNNEQEQRQKEIDARADEKARKELEPVIAKLKDKDGVVRAKPMQTIESFLDQVQYWRVLSIEVVCEHNGVRFNNMDGMNAYDAYNIASRKRREEVAKNVQKLQKDIDARADEKAREELATVIAKLKNEDGVVRARPTQSIESFLDIVQQWRVLGTEVICEFNGVRFNNMDGMNAYDSYGKAKREQEHEIEKNREQVKSEELKQREKELGVAIMSLPDSGLGYSIEDLVAIISHVSAIALEKEPAINLTPGLCTKLGNFLMTAGFAPVAEELKYQNAGHIGMSTYAPPAPTGKKTVELPFYSGCAIYVPEGIDLMNIEQLKNYAIGNFLEQLKTGKLDVANLELFERLAHQLARQKEAEQR